MVREKRSATRTEITVSLWTTGEDMYLGIWGERTKFCCWTISFLFCWNQKHWEKSISWRL